MSEQVNLPCKGRIRFLSTFSPTMNNGGGIEEVRSASRDQLSDSSLYFDNGFDSAYAAHLAKLIKKGDSEICGDRPRVLIVHGQAGDGKTSFLYRFFRDKLQYDLRNKKNSADGQRSYYHIQLSSDIISRCELYCVLDMSELSGNPTEKQKVMDDIFAIVTSDCTEGANDQLRTQATQGVNKIVVLAANNGAILDSFEDKLSSVENAQNVDPKRLAAWRDQVVEPLRQHFLGGNMSQFISEQAKESTDDNADANSVLQLFSCDDVVINKNNKNKELRLLQNKRKQSKSARIILFDMGCRIDQDMLGRIIDSFFNEKEQFFAKCTQKQDSGECRYQRFCPIRQNYELLKVNDFEALKVGLAQLIDLQASNGHHINTRAILKLLSNTLLGCFKTEQDFNKERRYFDCENIDDVLHEPYKSLQLSIDNVRTKCCYLSGFYDDDPDVTNKSKVTFITNPYDNIFGLNLDLRDGFGWAAQDALIEDVAYKQESANDQYNVFRIMCKTGLGDYSNTYVDSVIKALLDNDLSSCPWPWLEQDHFLKDNWVIKSLLEGLRKLKKQEDDLFEENQRSVGSVKNNKKYQQLKQKHYALMGSLRRALFFCLQPKQLNQDYQHYVSECEAHNVKPQQQVSPNLFAVSAFPHALEFLKFWQGEGIANGQRDRNAQNANYSFAKLGRDLVRYRYWNKDKKDDYGDANDAKYSAWVQNETAQKLSDAMVKFLSGMNPNYGSSGSRNWNWTLFESVTDNSLVLNVLLDRDSNKSKQVCTYLGQFKPFSDAGDAGWFFMASEDSLHLPQFVFRQKTQIEMDATTTTTATTKMDVADESCEDDGDYENDEEEEEDEDEDDDGSLSDGSHKHFLVEVVAYPITALSFETLMQIYNGALVINFTSRLSGDLLRFKQSLLVMQPEK